MFPAKSVGLLAKNGEREKGDSGTLPKPHYLICQTGIQQSL